MTGHIKDDNGAVQNIGKDPGTGNLWSICNENGGNQDFALVEVVESVSLAASLAVTISRS